MSDGETHYYGCETEHKECRDARFLREVERRAGASREDMAATVRGLNAEFWQSHDLDCHHYISEGEGDCDCALMLADWLRRILGEQP